MTDVFNKQKRSQVMAAIRSSGNKATELKLILIMRQFQIIGWRRKQRLPGKPDFVFPGARLAVFVDGCFWHGCSRHCRLPKTRIKYWRDKIARNMERDRVVLKQLRTRQWNALRIWEHSLRNPERIAVVINRALANRR